MKVDNISKEGKIYLTKLANRLLAYIQRGQNMDLKVVRRLPEEEKRSLIVFYYKEFYGAIPSAYAMDVIIKVLMSDKSTEAIDKQIELGLVETYNEKYRSYSVIQGRLDQF